MRFDNIKGDGRPGSGMLAAILCPMHEQKQVESIAARLAVSGWYSIGAQVDQTPYGSRFALLYRVPAKDYSALQSAYYAARRAELGSRPHPNYFKKLITGSFAALSQ